MFDLLKRFFKKKPSKVNVKWDDSANLDNPFLYKPIPYCANCEYALRIHHLWCPHCKTFLVWGE